MRLRPHLTAVALAGALVACLAAAADAGCDRATSYDELLAAGDTAAAANEWDRAEDCYREAHDKRPRQSSGEALFRLSQIAAKQGDPKLVAERLYTILAIPQVERVGFYRAELGLHLLRNKDVRRAEEQLSKFGWPVAYWLTADHALGDFERNAEWEAAVDRFVSLSAEVTKNGRREDAFTIDAVRALVRAIQINAAGGRAHVSAWQDAIGGLPETVSTLRRVLDAYPDHPLANFVAGFLLSMPAELRDKVDLTDTQQVKALASAAKGIPPRLDLPLPVVQDLYGAPQLSARLGEIANRLDARLARLAVRDFQPPRVTLLGRKAGDSIVTTLTHVWVVLEATDDKALVAVEVLVEELDAEGKTIGRWLGRESLTPLTAHTRLYRLHLPGPPARDARYRISFAAIDQQNRRSDDLPSGEVTQISVQYRQQLANVRKVYLIGVEEYQNAAEFPALPGVIENDVGPLDEYFQRVGVRSKRVVNQQVTESSLGDLFDAVEDGVDEVVFYFSGHGGKKGETNASCLFTYDGRCKKLTEIANAVDGSKALRVGMIVDACFSGYPVFPTGTFQSNPGRSGWERTYVASVSANETAKMVNRASVFTSVLQRILREPATAAAADTNKNGYVSLDEAFNYARDFITDRMGGQGPKKYGTDGHDFILVERPAAAVAAETLEKLTEKPAFRKYNRLLDALKAQANLEHASTAIVDTLLDKARLRGNFPDEEVDALLTAFQTEAGAVPLTVEKVPARP